jgi:hypothetical protein
MSNLFSKITSLLSGDIAFFVTLLVIFFIIVTYLGRSKIALVIISFYPTIFFYKALPFIDKLLVLKGEALITLNKVIVFGVIWLLLYL